MIITFNDLHLALFDIIISNNILIILSLNNLTNNYMWISLLILQIVLWIWLF